MARLGTTLLLIAAVARAQEDETAAIRKFIDSRRTELGRKQVELQLPKALPDAGPITALEVEARFGHHVFRRTLLRFLPGKDTCRIERLTHVGALSRSLVWPGSEKEVEEASGVRFARASMPRADYDRLCREIAAIGLATLRPRGEVPIGTSFPSTASGYVRLVFIRDGRRRVASDGITAPHAPDKGTALHEISDGLLRLLLVGWIFDRMEAVEFQNVEVPQELLERCRRELMKCGNREFERLSFRLHVLGECGYAPARASLEALRKRAPNWTDRIDLALAQIDALNAEDRRAALLRAADHPDGATRAWAEMRIKRDYPDDYRGILEKRLESRHPSERERAYAALFKMSPDDGSLLERGLQDPSGQIRLSCATRLWEKKPEPRVAAVLLAVARDRTLTSEFESSSRAMAAELVGGLGPPVEEGPVRRALTRMLTDEKEDVLVRGGAAKGLGELGSRASIVVLREQFKRPPPKKPLYHGVDRDFGRADYLQSDDMRGPIAGALAALAAVEATPDLAAFLLREPTQNEHNLRPLVGQALAALGGPSALAAIEKERSRQAEAAGGLRKHWDDMLVTVKLFQPGASARRILASDCSGFVPRRCLVRHLAHFGSVEDLRKLQGEFPKEAEVIDSALARKQEK